jgi:hypothetical protein
MCWTLWWNLDWKRVMRFWLKPPYRRWVEIVFRVFFAIGFLSAVNRFVRQLLSHPFSGRDFAATVGIAAIMCAVVAATSASVLWMALRRDAKAASRTGAAGKPESAS